MHYSTILAFALVALIAIATPGPTVLLALANGSRFGLRLSVAGMLGAVASDFVLIGAVAMGLGAVLTASEFWFSVLKWVGAAYLAWLGWRLLRSNGEVDLSAASVSTAQGGASPRALFAKSFMVAVTNPKGYLFCTALLPQFIDPAAPQSLQYATISVVFATLDFAVMFAYAAVGAHAMRLLRRRAILWMDRCCGGALLVLSGSLLFYRRDAAY